MSRTTLQSHCDTTGEARVMAIETSNRLFAFARWSRSAEPSYAVSVAALRMGTWNVEYANPVKNDARLKLLHDANADIWVLTETRDELDLGAPYAAVSSARRYPDKATPRWVTIWSKLPFIQRVSVIDTSRTVAAIYETPLGRLLVYGTVLPWHTDRDPQDTRIGPGTIG